jgi:hypothetical protein
MSMKTERGGGVFPEHHRDCIEGSLGAEECPSASQISCLAPALSNITIGTPVTTIEWNSAQLNGTIIALNDSIV